MPSGRAKRKAIRFSFFSSPFLRRKGKRAEIKGWHDHRPPNVAHLLSNVFRGGGVCCRRVLHFQRHHRAGLRYCGVGKFFMRTILVFVVCNCACAWSCVLANQVTKMKELVDLSHCYFCKVSALCNNKGKIHICEIAGRQESLYTLFAISDYHTYSNKRPTSN